MRKPNQDISPEAALATWNTARPAEDAEPVVIASCKLITPMYGGGVKPGEVDHDMPIRASALRGQLRFWWRLLHGAGKDSTDLFIDESALWGGISSDGPQASKVAVQVEGAPAGEQQLKRKRELDIPTYALILERGDDPFLVQADYSFKLVLRFKEEVTPAQREGVVEALRWWASFGGVGARTRRGLGAAKVAVVRDGIGLAPVTGKEVRARGGWMVTGQPTTTAAPPWKDAVDALWHFRQGVEMGRNQGLGNRPGRSRWPEADTIRRATNTHAPMHKPEHPVDGFYPRAAFGLPLVFHFKDKNEGDPRGQDSDSLVLNPEGHDRMASPLILRPYFDGRQYRPMALLLPGWEKRISTPVHFNSRQGKPAWPEDSREREWRAESIKPMVGRGSDALSAFMHYFQETLKTRAG